MCEPQPPMRTAWAPVCRESVVSVSPRVSVEPGWPGAHRVRHRVVTDEDCTVSERGPGQPRLALHAVLAPSGLRAALGSDGAVGTPWSPLKYVPRPFCPRTLPRFSWLVPVRRGPRPSRPPSSGHFALCEEGAAPGLLAPEGLTGGGPPSPGPALCGEACEPQRPSDCMVLLSGTKFPGPGDCPLSSLAPAPPLGSEAVSAAAPGRGAQSAPVWGAGREPAGSGPRCACHRPASLVAAAAPPATRAGCPSNAQSLGREQGPAQTPSWKAPYKVPGGFQSLLGVLRCSGEGAFPRDTGSDGYLPPSLEQAGALGSRAGGLGS